MSDYRDQIQSQRGPLKDLLSNVPGFKGYLEKEDRRTADKLIREEVADRYGRLLTKLNAVQTRLLDQGMLDLMDDLESVVDKIQTSIDRIRNASYGYSSFFSAVKIDQETLDRLYEYDRSLLERAEEVQETLLALEAAESEPDARSLIGELNAQAQEMLDDVDQRQDVVTSE